MDQADNKVLFHNKKANRLLKSGINLEDAPDPKTQMTQQQTGKQEFLAILDNEIFASCEQTFNTCKRDMTVDYQKTVQNLKNLDDFKSIRQLIAQGEELGFSGRKSVYKLKQDNMEN